MKYRIVRNALGEVVEWEAFKDNKVPKEYAAIVEDVLPPPSQAQKEEMELAAKRSAIAGKVGEYFLDWVENSTEPLEEYIKSKVNAFSIQK